MPEAALKTGGGGTQDQHINTPTLLPFASHQSISISHFPAADIMLGLVSLLVPLATLAAAQQTSFKPSTGVRSLWVRKFPWPKKKALNRASKRRNMLTKKQIPFKTVGGIPLASIAGGVSLDTNA